MGKDTKKRNERKKLRKERRAGRVPQKIAENLMNNCRWKEEKIEREQGRIHDCSSRGRLGRGSNDLGRGSFDLGRGMLKYKLSNP